jgi:hypothetical protein
MAYESYLATIESPLRRAKARAALERQMRLDGRYMFRWQMAEEMATRPMLRLDSAKGRLYHGADGRFYDVASLTSTAVDYIIWLTGGVPCSL